MRKTILTILVSIAVSLCVCFLLIDREPVMQGVSQGNEYVATSTASSNNYGAFTNDQLLKAGWGTLGSVVITGANTGVINFYNASTSDITKRTGNKATTTLLIASMPASLTAGTYVFDAIFTNGLWLELESGSMPTTTILYR